MAAFADPTQTHPITAPDGTPVRNTVFLNRVLTNPNFRVGDFTYASDFDAPEDWSARLAPYLFENSRETLQIGKFCQIAHGVRFITSSANHAMDGATTYPFAIFEPRERAEYQPDRRDTLIGHDVWFGCNAMICPGARIGSGAIIGAGSVVRGQIPPYARVTGNPGQVQKYRFDDTTITRLLHLAWWDWPAETIAAARAHLVQGDIDKLEQIAPTPLP